MAARIMVVYNDHEIAINSEAYHLSRHELDDECFAELPLRKMKGIDDSGTIYAYRKRLARFACFVIFKINLIRIYKEINAFYKVFDIKVRYWCKSLNMYVYIYLYFRLKQILLCLWIVRN